MYALVDYDADGISILRTYQVGSSSLIHEENTTVPHIRWLGIRSDQILPSTQSADVPALTQSSQETGSSQTSETLQSQDTTVDDDGMSQSHSTLRSRRSRNRQLEALSNLTPRDRRMATSLLQGICQEQRVGEHNGAGRIREVQAEQIRELQMMLMLNVKAEIQAVDNLGDITHWLDERLCK